MRYSEIVGVSPIMDVGKSKMKDFAIWGSGKKVLIMAKEYIEREVAKARLRMWITDCVLDGDNDEADCFRDYMGRRC